MRRGSVIFVTSLLLWAVVSEANHALAGWHIYLWIAGLFVTYAALSLPLRDGLLATLGGGLLCDATTPVTFGTHMLLFAAAHVIIFNIRDRVPRDETAGRVVIALLANLTLFLVFSFLQISKSPSPAAAWPRIVCDLICSQIFLALIAPWFFALQARSLDLVHAAAPADEHRLD
jgi:rod shape-determining protein MreD